MVEIRVEKNDVCDAVITGDLTSIIAEVAIGIGAIYQSIMNSANESAAEVFRIGLLVAMDPDSPTWLPRDGLVTINKSTKKSGTPTDQS